MVGELAPIMPLAHRRGNFFVDLSVCVAQDFNPSLVHHTIDRGDDQMRFSTGSRDGHFDSRLSGENKGNGGTSRMELLREEEAGHHAIVYRRTAGG